MEYDSFIQSKAKKVMPVGFSATGINQQLFDFQRAIVEWACLRGRAAIFADTGLGKTPMQVEWARQVANHTGGRVLIVAPLCVARGDLVFSPFTGIGSEGYVALQMGRRFVGAELKKSYFDLAVRNLEDATKENTQDLFGEAA